MTNQTPLERIEEALGLFGKAGTLVFQADDVRLLRSIALEAVAIVGDPDRYDLHRDVLCGLIGEYLGAEGHDWSEWGDPYDVDGDMWHERVCRRCGEQDFERVPEQESN